nr:immunoglobulin light chain junction region [Macaca mulatta]MOX08138.1 immunoglobulin light chain junction region [Macaca mulatta]MOX08215.1 immunoglobulin light chain junction region [Macaca mulatta]MOX08496.1 immunoglobulin light chain junction region [Macaca mulatta]MOX09269.1 immunoglobulin light chain junction region [Macaca mulatta]
CQQGDTYPYSF